MSTTKYAIDGLVFDFLTEAELARLEMDLPGEITLIVEVPS